MTLAGRLAQAKKTAAAETPTGDRQRTPGVRTAALASGPYEGVKVRVKQALLENLGPTLYDPHMTQNSLEGQVRQTLLTVIEQEDAPLTGADRTRIAQEVADDILGYGPLEPYLRDPAVTEVMVNGPDQIFVERDGRITCVEGIFADEAHLRRTIDKIVSRVGRRVDESSPMVDARLPDGSRVNAVIPPMPETINPASGDITNRGAQRARRNTPAVTIVAAWINAETGVGPSMASGSQVWSGT